MDARIAILYAMTRCDTCSTRWRRKVRNAPADDSNGGIRCYAEKHGCVRLGDAPTVQFGTDGIRLQKCPFLNKFNTPYQVCVPF